MLAYIDGLVQERRNSGALAMELRLSCTNPSILYHIVEKLAVSTENCISDVNMENFIRNANPSANPRISSTR